MIVEFDITTTTETITMIPVEDPSQFMDYRKTAFVALQKKLHPAATPFYYVYGLISTPNMIPPYIYGVASNGINPDTPDYFVKIRNFDGIVVADTNDLATRIKTWFDA